MRLAPTTEQADLKAAVRRFCAEQITPERLRAWEHAPRGIDDQTWQAIADLGWFGLGIPAEHGGSGVGLVELACVLEECARGLIPLTVINAICSAYALATIAPQNPDLRALAARNQSATCAFDEEHTRDARRYATQLVLPGALPLIDGEKWYVPDAAHADLHIVAVRSGHSMALVLVSREVAAASALRTFDGDRQAIVRYDRATVFRMLAEGPGAELAFTRVHAERRALAFAELLGTMSGALDMAVAYVKEREQFGQKIGVFQAVQHQVADMATASTAARHLAWQAITRLASGTIQGNELAVAAAFVGQAAKRITLTAHHLFGGAGYVIEHPLHYHAERAQSLCIRHAAEAPALASVADALLDS